MARTNVTEAFYFCRGQPEYAQQHMFHLLISFVLNNSPAETAADRSVELVGLPFNRQEEAWFEDYLLRGEGIALKKGKDTLMIRKLGTGNFTESMPPRGIHHHVIGGLEWGSLSGAVKEGLGSRS